MSHLQCKENAEYNPHQLVNSLGKLQAVVMTGEMPEIKLFDKWSCDAAAELRRGNRWTHC